MGGNLRLARRGQIIGGVLGGLVIVGGFCLIAAGKDVQGFITLVGDALLFGSIYVTGRRTQRDELSKKRTPPEQP